MPPLLLGSIHFLKKSRVVFIPAVSSSGKFIIVKTEVHKIGRHLVPYFTPELSLVWVSLWVSSRHTGNSIKRVFTRPSHTQNSLKCSSFWLILKRLYPRKKLVGAEGFLELGSVVGSTVEELFLGSCYGPSSMEPDQH